MNVNSPKFLQNHVVIHEIISMNNGKYRIWKLIFPRVEDTFVTADKLLDLWVWEELYSVLKRITLQYNASETFDKQTIGKNRYELSFEKIQMSIECIRNLFNVDTKLIHDVLCVNMSVNTNYNQSFIEKLAKGETNSASSSSEESHRNSIDARSNRLIQKRPFSALQLSAEPALAKDIYSSSESSYESSSDSDSDESSPASKVTKVDTSQKKNIDSTSTTTEENFDIPKNLHELLVLMKDRKYLDKFGFKCKNQNLRLFDDIYTVDGDISYAAFQSAETIKHIRGKKDCKLYFYYSQEMLKQFNSFSTVKFSGVNHILIVFVNVEYEELTPLGYFLLSKKDKSLQSVLTVIDRWLNGNGSTTFVNKCLTPYDAVLQQSIFEVWPTTKILPCSIEYQTEIKLFALQNKGLGADHKTKLTRLACTLCYLEERYIAVGIEVIKTYSASEYGTLLVKHLRTKWLGRLKSVNREKIICRSLNICKRFSKQMERDYFTKYNSFGTYEKEQKKHQHVWEFIEFLRTLTDMTVLDMVRYSAGAMPSNKTFECNTSLQKEKENRYWSSIEEFSKNVNITTEFKAVEKCMLQMALNV